MAIDLTGGEAKVIGNKGDLFYFRLSNPVEQDLIEAEGEYSAEFSTNLHKGTPTDVELDESELDEGALIIPVTIETGYYVVRRSSDPIRTLIVIKVEAR